MVQRGATDLKARLIKQEIVFQLGCDQVLARKSAAPGKLSSGVHAITAVFDDAQHDMVLIAANEIPGVGAELRIDSVDQPRRSVEVHDLVATEHKPQQAIEPDEVVHVPMATLRHANARQRDCCMAGGSVKCEARMLV